MYDHAVSLINAGKAYVDDQTPVEIKNSRGTLKEPGKESPYKLYDSLQAAFRRP